MEIKVDLSPEQINGQICEAIAKSAIGIELKKVIEKEVEALGRSYNNPFNQIVTTHIHREIERIVREDYKEEIAAFVQEKVTADFTEEMLVQLWNAWEAGSSRNKY